MSDKYDQVPEALWRLMIEKNMPKDGVDFDEPFPTDQYEKAHPEFRQLREQVEQEYHYELSEPQCSWAVHAYLQWDWDEYVRRAKVLTADNVQRIFRDCLFTEDEDTSHQVLARGIMSNAGFHPGRLAAHKDEIRAMLMDLPDQFRRSGGGGRSFLNACHDRHGNQWGEHPNMEQLFLLGIASGQVTCTAPREMWPSLPGGMPYYVIEDMPGAQEPKAEEKKVKVYKEDDWVAEVEVLEDNSDADWHRYKLRVIRTIHESALYKPTADGEVFEVEQSRHGAWGGMWHLEDLEDAA